MPIPIRPIRRSNLIVPLAQAISLDWSPPRVDAVTLAVDPSDDDDHIRRALEALRRARLDVFLWMREREFDEVARLAALTTAHVVDVSAGSDVVIRLCERLEAGSTPHARSPEIIPIFPSDSLHLIETLRPANPLVRQVAVSELAKKVEDGPGSPAHMTAVAFTLGELVTEAAAVGCQPIVLVEAAEPDLVGDPRTSQELDTLLLDRCRSLGARGVISRSRAITDTASALFGPRQDEISYAHQVRAAYSEVMVKGQGLTTIGDRFIDLPSDLLAQQVLEHQVACQQRDAESAQP